MHESMVQQAGCGSYTSTHVRSMRVSVGSRKEKPGDRQ